MKEDFLFLPSYDEAPLNIELAGVSFCDGSYHIRRKCSNVTVLEYVLEGEGYIIRNGEKLTAAADEVYILKAGEEHNYYSSAKNPWKKIFINVIGDFSLVLLEKYGISENTVFDGRGLRHIFERIEKAVNTNDRSPAVHIALTSVFFEVIANLALRNHMSENSEAAELKHFLDTNTHRIVKNSELAALIYHSVDYTIKLFSKEYGITPYEYQIGEKMSIAKKLLKNTLMPISEISIALGYSDAHYFSGLFKSRHGLSPKEYRKLNFKMPSLY